MHPFIQRAAATVAMPLACAFLAGNSLCFAADSTVEKPDAVTPLPTTPANSHEAELEAKIKRLEKRIDDLESQAEQRPRQNNNQQIQTFRNRMKRDLSNDFDENLFDQILRREMEQGTEMVLNNGAGGLQFDFGPQFGGGNVSFGGRATAEKPRLGVQLAPATDELRERFKNDVKQGAFVIAVVPDSPAEKAGIMVGHADSPRWAGVAVADAQSTMDAIRNAPKGRTEITVTRQGKELALNADLAELADNTSLDSYVQGQNGPGVSGGRWLRKRDMNNGNRGAATAPGAAGNNANGAVQSRTELKASALEMTDELATSLKLTDEQKTKMADVLRKEAQKASDEASAGAKSPGLRTRRYPPRHERERQHRPHRRQTRGRRRRRAEKCAQRRSVARVEGLP